MQIYHSLADVPLAEGRIVSIGTFDGVHLGHQQVLLEGTRRAQTMGLHSLVLTFDPHPLSVVAPKHCPALLTTLNQKIDLIARLGVQELLVIPFTVDFSKLTSKEFCALIFQANLGAKQIVVGENFHFGRGGEGNASTLKSCAMEYGITAVNMPLLHLEDQPVSSTRIRELLSGGQPVQARKLLGRPFAVRGRVVRGEGRGKPLGVPTANLELEDSLLLPMRGVYIGAARLCNDSGQEELPYAAALNVGNNPTFSPPGKVQPLQVEAHLLDYEDDLYGKVLEVEFLHRLRDEIRYNSPDELIGQMNKDLSDTRRYFETSNT